MKSTISKKNPMSEWTTSDRISILIQSKWPSTPIIHNIMGKYAHRMERIMWKGLPRSQGAHTHVVFPFKVGTRRASILIPEHQQSGVQCGIQKWGVKIPIPSVLWKQSIHLDQKEIFQVAKHLHALIIVARKLHPNFHAHEITVLTNELFHTP